MVVDAFKVYLIAVDIHGSIAAAYRFRCFWSLRGCGGFRASDVVIAILAAYFLFELIYIPYLGLGEE